MYSHTRGNKLLQSLLKGQKQGRSQGSLVPPPPPPYHFLCKKKILDNTFNSWVYTEDVLIFFASVTWQTLSQGSLLPIPAEREKGIILSPYPLNYIAIAVMLLVEST